MVESYYLPALGSFVLASCLNYSNYVYMLSSRMGSQSEDHWQFFFFFFFFYKIFKKIFFFYNLFFFFIFYLKNFFYFL